MAQLPADGSSRSALNGSASLVERGTSGRTLIMGVLNVTPDSFSDGGAHADTVSAVAHARRLVADGADIVDVGGESTRPGATRVSAEVEQRRVLPVIRALVDEGIVVSVDTMNASTAAQSIALGAAMINDVSGGLADPRMAAVLASSEALFIVSHWRGHSDDMDSRAVYGDVVEDVVSEVTDRVASLVDAGIPEGRMVIDPGLGFAKRGGQNWAMLAGYDRFASIGLPVLVGASRKRFLDDGNGTRPDERDIATAAVSLLAAERGAWGVRVHDPASTRTVLEVLGRWRGAES